PYRHRRLTLEADRAPPLLFLPTGASGEILQKHTTCREVVADAIGRGKIAPPPRGMPLLEQPFDFIDRDWRLLVFGAAEAQDAEHAVELLENTADRRHVAGAEVAGV